MKKIPLIIVALVLWTLSVSPGYAVESDVNKNGVVDYLDLIAVIDSFSSVFQLNQLVWRFGSAQQISPTVTNEPPTPTNTPNPKGRLAPVRISSNGKYLVMENGEPFFWMADTAWDFHHRLTRQDMRLYLDDRQAKGFTVIMFRIPLNAKSTREGTRLENREGKIHVNNMDWSRINQSYFDLVDYSLDEMEKRGLVAGFLPGWGWATNNSAENNGFMYRNANPTTLKNYATFLANRYKDKKNIIWITGGDTSMHDKWEAMAKELKRIDSDALVTFHPGAGQTSSWHAPYKGSTVGDANWLDFHMTQTGHSYNVARPYAWVSEVYSGSSKPIVNAESLYEDIARNLTDPENEYHMRVNTYWSLFAGGFGFTYGHTDVWQFARSVPNQIDTWRANEPWQDVLSDPGAMAMKHLGDLWRSVEWWKYVPRQELIASANPEGDNRPHIRAIRKSDKTEAMIYTPKKQKFTVRMSELDGENVRARWFNPINGKFSDVTTHATSGTKQFSPPFSQDSVLVLD